MYISIKRIFQKTGFLGNDATVFALFYKIVLYVVRCYGSGQDFPIIPVFLELLLFMDFVFDHYNNIYLSNRVKNNSTIYEFQLTKFAKLFLLLHPFQLKMYIFLII